MNWPPRNSFRSVLNAGRLQSVCNCSSSDFDKSLPAERGCAAHAQMTACAVFSRSLAPPATRWWKRACGVVFVDVPVCADGIRLHGHRFNTSNGHVHRSRKCVGAVKTPSHFFIWFELVLS